MGDPKIRKVHLHHVESVVVLQEKCGVVEKHVVPAASVTTCAIAAPEEWLPRTGPVAASSRRRLRSEPPGEEPFSIWRNFHGRSLDVVGLAQRGAGGFPGAGIVAEH